MIPIAYTMRNIKLDMNNDFKVAQSHRRFSSDQQYTELRFKIKPKGLLIFKIYKVIFAYSFGMLATKLRNLCVF